MIILSKFRIRSDQMKMKKILIAIVILSLSLTACGKKPVNQVKEEGQKLEKDKEVVMEDKKEIPVEVEGKEGNIEILEFVNQFVDMYGADRITSIKIKDKRTGRVIEIEGYDEKFEYEGKFSEGGEVIKEERERLESDDRYENNGFSVDEISDLLSYEEILDIVTKETDNYIESVKLKMGYKGLIYEVDTEGRNDLELIIDGSTGEILDYDD